MIAMNLDRSKLILVVISATIFGLIIHYVFRNKSDLGSSSENSPPSAIENSKIVPDEDLVFPSGQQRQPEVGDDNAQNIIEGDLALSEKLEELLRLAKTTEEKYNFVSRLFEYLITNGAKFEDIIELAAQVPAGVTGNSADRVIYRGFAKKEPMKVWQWLQDGISDHRLQSSLLRSFERDCTVLAAQKGFSNLEDFLVEGIKSGNENTMLFHGAPHAIHELGKAGKFTRQLLEKVLSSGKEVLFGPAYNAWIGSLESQQILEEIRLREFPREIRTSAAQSALRALSDESLEDRLKWVDSNSDLPVGQLESIREKVFLQEIGMFSKGGISRIIPVLRKIESKNVFESVSKNMLTLLKNPRTERHFPEQRSALVELKKYLSERELEK